MRRLFASRRRVLAVTAVAAVAIAVAAGYGYAAITATNNTYTGCLFRGSIINVAIGPEPTKPCQQSKQKISWSQTGPQGLPGQNGTNGTNGTDGVSVTSETEPAGANCATGGSLFTAADNNVTYACNGAKGDKGDPGPANLAALRGSPCTFEGKPSKLDVSVDNTTGAVSMTCIPVYEVSITVTNGTLQTILIQDRTTHMTWACNGLSTCSIDMPKPSGLRPILDQQCSVPLHLPRRPNAFAAVQTEDGFFGSCLDSSLSGHFRRHRQPR